ncbi:proline-rich receptor-like protein kinase PERK3 [Pistacia vera]|uniref:proline-rich receptor-like protein kinase PERK3 n=1 Tax=Pistacia vera TaxID=55513 RepID=UPI0012634DC4|nr:proline-rich receptor-like protein kinase PERK3 [Pistacia vera]
MYLPSAAGKPRIVHCDISSANIILDEKWEAKVAGFGLVTSILADETRISTKVEGSFGYIDPEFFPTGKLNEKVDVYAFGMLLLELITGCLPVNKIQPSDPENLAVKAKPMLTEAVKDNNINVVYTDPMLGKFDKSERLRMVHGAAPCVCYPARDRPQMSQEKEIYSATAIALQLIKNIFADMIKYPENHYT